MIDWHIQGLLGIAFFEATAFLILLVLLVLLRRDGGGSRGQQFRHGPRNRDRLLFHLHDADDSRAAALRGGVGL